MIALQGDQPVLKKAQNANNKYNSRHFTPIFRITSQRLRPLSTSLPPTPLPPPQEKKDKNKINKKREKGESKKSDGQGKGDKKKPLYLLVTNKSPKPVASVL